MGYWLPVVISIILSSSLALAQEGSAPNYRVRESTIYTPMALPTIKVGLPVSPPSIDAAISRMGSFQMSEDGSFVYCPLPYSPSEQNSLRDLTGGPLRSCFNPAPRVRYNFNLDSASSLTDGGTTNFLAQRRREVSSDATIVVSASYTGFGTGSFGNGTQITGLRPRTPGAPVAPPFGGAFIGTYLAPRDEAKDRQTCACLENSSETSLDGTLYNAFKPTNLTQDVINSNIDRINELVTAERNAALFQASTLNRDQTVNEALTTVYNTEYTPPIGPQIRRIQTGVEKFYDAQRKPTQQSVQMKRFETNPKPLESLFNADSTEAGSCIPSRLYRAMQMVPASNDLASFRDLPAEFRPEDWDFQALRSQLIEKSRSSTSLIEARTRDPEVEKIFQRIQFLHRNGMVRNLFSADNNLPNASNLKRDLYQRIRATFNSPELAPNSPQRFQKFRDSLMVFFGGGADASTAGTYEQIKALTQSGANINMSALLQNMPDRAVSITASTEPAILFSQAVRENQASIQELNPSLASADQGSPETNALVFARYCRSLQFSSSVNRWTVMRDLDMALERNFKQNLTEDGEFGSLSASVCSNPRKSADGTSMTFEDFQRVACSGTRGLACAQESREPGQQLRQRLARFLTEFPEPSSGADQETVRSLIPLLQGDTISSVRPQVIADAAVAGGGSTSSRVTNADAVIQRAAASTTDVTGMTNYAAERERSSSRSIASVRPTNGQSETQTQTQSQNQQQRENGSTVINPGAVFQPQEAAGVAAASVTPERKAEVQRQVEESDTEIQSLSSQIAGIRDSVRAQRDSGVDPNSQQLRDLNDRLAGLESSLTQERTKNTNLQRQLAQMNQLDNQRPATVAGSAPRDDFSSSGSFRPQVSAPQAQAQNQGAAPQAGTGPLPQGGTGGLGGGSLSRGATISRGGTSGVNGALLSGQRVDENSGGSGTAITVSSTSSSDYLRLLSQTAGNEITESVPADVYGQIASGDMSALERYRERIEALPGQVVRLELRAQGSGEQVELIFVKNGGLLTVATRNGRAIASESEAAAPVERNATLQDLNNTVRDAN